MLSTTRRWHVQLVMLVSVLTGSTALIFGRLAQQEDIPTFYLVTFRLAFSSLALAPLVFARYGEQMRSLSRRALIFGGLGGLWMALHFNAVFVSIEFTSILVCNVLIGTGPLWVALAEARLLKVPLNKWVWAGLFCTLTGSVVVALSADSGFNLGENPLVGVVLALAGALVAALYTLFGRQARGQMAFVPYLWLIYTSGAVFSLVLVIFSGTPLVGYSAAGYTYLALLTLIPQLVGHSTYNYALRHLPATYVSIFGQLGLVLGAVLAFVVFHEIPGTLQIPGSAAILIGITLVNLGQGRSPN